MTAATVAVGERLDGYGDRYAAEQRRHKRRVWVAKMWGEKYVAGYLCGLEVSEGGWFATGGRVSGWLSKAEIEGAERRMVARSYDGAPRDPAYPDYIPNQCGGCRFFAALNADWGICVNERSPLDGRVTFEHGGCVAHSEYEVPSSEDRGPSGVAE